MRLCQFTETSSGEPVSVNPHHVRKIKENAHGATLTFSNGDELNVDGDFRSVVKEIQDGLSGVVRTPGGIQLPRNPHSHDV